MFEALHRSWSLNRNSLVVLAAVYTAFPHFSAAFFRWMKITLYTVSPKKEATKLLAITFSNLNRFSKFFHCWKQDEYFQQNCVIFFHHTLSMFLHSLGMLIVQIYCKLQQKKSKSVPYLTKMKRLCCHTVGWRQAYCFLQHMLEVSAVRLHEDAYATALSMMLSSTLHTCCTHCLSSSVLYTRDWYTTLAVGRRSRSCNQGCSMAKPPKIRWNERWRKFPNTSRVTGSTSSCFDRSTSR